jgi:hypothetical protein
MDARTLALKSAVHARVIYQRADGSVRSWALGRSVGALAVKRLTLGGGFAEALALGLVDTIQITTFHNQKTREFLRPHRPRRPSLRPMRLSNPHFSH